ncbi:MAG: hypothetical protein H5U01_13515, partial [Clostridia bacterium]|nr:hypothetical protein [Clostridia bacterium]
MSTVYGLAGPAGGTAALSVPASVGCSVEPFELLLTVRNTSLEVLRNGSAMLGLPAGTNLAPGYHATVGLGDLAPGQMTTVSWQAQITALDP